MESKMATQRGRRRLRDITGHKNKGANRRLTTAGLAPDDDNSIDEPVY